MALRPEAWLRLAWTLGGLVLATAVIHSPPFARLERGWGDLEVRWLAGQGAALSAAVVDIDDAALREVRADVGDWPFARDVHARIVDRLLDAGAERVVFNIVFADERKGDEALRQRIEGGRVVLAAAARQSPPQLEDSAAFATPAGAWSDPGLARAPAVGWASVSAPAPTLRSSTLADAGALAGRTGIVTIPLSDDGLLRRLPLLHRVGAATMPSLALAAFGLQEPPRYQRSDGTLQAAGLRWAVDDMGSVLPLVPAGGALLSVPLAPLVKGQTQGLADLSGRTVFVGSPQGLEPQVMTPQGQIGTTAWWALAYDALHRGAVLKPRSAAIDATLWVLALLPAAFALGSPRPRLRREVLTTALAAAAVLLIGGAVLFVGRQQVSLLPVLTTLLLLMLAAAANQSHWFARESRRAEVARASAEAASQAKTDFLAHMSHEIRTPLNAMLGMAQLLSETPLSEAQRRHLDVFRDAGRHLRELVDDVLDLARIEAGQLALHDEPFSLKALLDEVAALFEPQAHAKSLRFGLEVHAALPPWVMGDRHRLRQVLVNLVGNAIKFTPAGQVQLRAGLAPGPRLVLRVTDTGIGVPAERLKAIFEPFTQADAGIARRYGGSGLGLAITRRLVLAMQGTIEVDSRAHVGTDVRIGLPLRACPAPPPAAEPTVAAPADAAQWRGRRILLVEDNEFNILVATGMLEPTGLEIDVARDGHEAVARAAERAHDLILMDIQMPGMDGLSATREIRRAEAERALRPVPIIALTANAMAGDASASAEAGCNAHLPKPIDKPQLLHMLSVHLGTAPPPLEPGAVRAHLGEDAHQVRRVLEAAREQFARWDEQFGAALAAGDLASCRRQAHDLKSVATAIGARALASAAAGLEQRCLKGPMPADAPERRAVSESLPAWCDRLDRELAR